LLSVQDGDDTRVAINSNARAISYTTGRIRG